MQQSGAQNRQIAQAIEIHRFLRNPWIPAQCMDPQIAQRNPWIAPNTCTDDAVATAQQGNNTEILNCQCHRLGPRPSEAKSRLTSVSEV